MKKFNTTAVCIPSKHYMVDLSARVTEIKKMVDAGEYFTINRARQYGKTTTIHALQSRLQQDYCVLSLSFEGITHANFSTEQSFVRASIQQMQMYGLIRNDHHAVRISNRIFETMLYNLFLSDEELKANVFAKRGDLGKDIFVADGKLNVRQILEDFIRTYHEVLGPLQDSFKEKDGRELFLLYLKPIINGTGNYYIEAQTRDQKRTDVIIDYLGEQYIIEMKIWRGRTTDACQWQNCIGCEVDRNKRAPQCGVAPIEVADERYNAEGEKQISEYLDYFGLKTGYMLSFNFNQQKETGVKAVTVGDRLIYEGTV